ncbi:MAG: thioredoxin-dependent peroxiredoxin [Patescibacteria group bacterium]|nr:thioredoxin-dependent peroxiredoxin [Patescibacteria group bacterium]
MLKVGDKAPDFELADQDGVVHHLKDYKGKKVVLYFYPKDNTPGCTVEACNFRDNIKSFDRLGAVIFGVSKDSIKSHKKFETNQSLNFKILSDESTEMIQNYSVWRQKKFMGREYMGIERTSYLIDENGKIEKIYEKVKPKEHTQEVLLDLKKNVENGIILFQHL